MDLHWPQQLQAKGARTGNVSLAILLEFPVANSYVVDASKGESEISDIKRRSDKLTTDGWPLRLEFDIIHRSPAVLSR